MCIFSSTGSCLTTHIAQVNPLREQVQALQTELQSVTGRLANAASLELKVTELTNEVASLRSQSAQADRLAVDVKSLQERLASVGGSNVAELNAAGASSNV